MKKTLSLFVLVIFVSSSVFAQQIPRYSQYMFNMLNINPAYAGNRDVTNINMLIRRQWVNFPGAPFSGSATYDKRISGSNNSFGGQIYSDRIGIEQTNGIQGFYSFTAPFENSSLAIGTSIGILNYNINYARSNPFDVGDPNLQLAINGFLPSAGLGMLYSRERWYLGFSAPALLKTKINSNNQSVIRQARADGHFFLTGGYIMPISEMFTVKPSFLLKAVSGAPIQADLNANIWYGDLLGAGVSYRHKESLVGMLELQVSPLLRIGYSYDHTTSKLIFYNSGTHEIMLRMELGGSIKAITSPRYY
jgi:type IX secretion system PorP/SprF family membrane protein